MKKNGGLCWKKYQTTRDWHPSGFFNLVLFTTYNGGWYSQLIYTTHCATEVEFLSYGVICTHSTVFLLGSHHEEERYEPRGISLWLVGIILPWWYFVNNMEMSDFNTTVRTTK